MRKIIIIMILLCTPLFGYGYENGTKYNVDRIFNKICTALKLDKDIEVIIVYLSPALSYNIMGMTERNPGGKYIIRLKKGMSNRDWEMTLIHEIIHMDQLEKGRIKVIDGETYWRGSTLIKNNPGHNRESPHETEAIGMAKSIYSKIN